jgi:type I restriction-modification system DNA methylase subunit
MKMERKFNMSHQPVDIIKTKRNNGHYHSDASIKQFGEVFTPDKLVIEMLDKLPQEVFTDKKKTFLDNSCGNGQFLYEVLKRKMEYLYKKQKISLKEAHKIALSTIYGCELDSNNAEECRLRLLNGSISKELRDIVDNNIITADALDSKHEGWNKVGFYWENEKTPQLEVVPRVNKNISLSNIKKFQLRKQMVSSSSR